MRKDARRNRLRRRRGRKRKGSSRQLDRKGRAYSKKQNPRYDLGEEEESRNVGGAEMQVNAARRCDEGYPDDKNNRRTRRWRGRLLVWSGGKGGVVRKGDGKRRDEQGFDVNVDKGKAESWKPDKSERKRP